MAERLGKGSLDNPDRLAEEAVMSGRHQQLIRSSISSIVASSSRYSRTSLSETPHLPIERSSYIVSGHVSLL